MAVIDVPYRPRAKSMLGAALFFGACAAIAAVKASGNERGLDVLGAMTLGVEGATRFYVGMAVVAGAMALAGAVGLVLAFRGKQRVVLEEDSLSAPWSGFARTAVVVPLADIAGLQVTEVSGQRMVHVDHRRGRLTVAESCMPPGTFETLVDELVLRLEVRDELARKLGEPPR